MHGLDKSGYAFLEYERAQREEKARPSQDDDLKAESVSTSTSAFEGLYQFPNENEGVTTDVQIQVNINFERLITTRAEQEREELSRFDAMFAEGYFDQNPIETPVVPPVLDTMATRQKSDEARSKLASERLRQSFKKVKNATAFVNKLSQRKQPPAETKRRSPSASSSTSESPFSTSISTPHSSKLKKGRRTAGRSKTERNELKRERARLEREQQRLLEEQKQQIEQRMRDLEKAHENARLEDRMREQSKQKYEQLERIERLEKRLRSRTPKRTSEQPLVPPWPMQPPSPPPNKDDAASEKVANMLSQLNSRLSSLLPILAQEVAMPQLPVPPSANALVGPPQVSQAQQYLARAVLPDTKQRYDSDPDIQALTRELAKLDLQHKLEQKRLELQRKKSRLVSVEERTSRRLVSSTEESALWRKPFREKDGLALMFDYVSHLPNDVFAIRLVAQVFIGQRPVGEAFATPFIRVGQASKQTSFDSTYVEHSYTGSVLVNERFFACNFAASVDANCIVEVQSTLGTDVQAVAWTFMPLFFQQSANKNAEFDRQLSEMILQSEAEASRAAMNEEGELNSRLYCRHFEDTLRHELQHHRVPKLSALRRGMFRLPLLRLPMKVDITKRDLRRLPSLFAQSFLYLRVAPAEWAEEHPTSSPFCENESEEVCTSLYSDAEASRPFAQTQEWNTLISDEIKRVCHEALERIDFADHESESENSVATSKVESEESGHNASEERRRKELQEVAHIARSCGLLFENVHLKSDFGFLTLRFSLLPLFSFAAFENRFRTLANCSPNAWQAAALLLHHMRSSLPRPTQITPVIEEDEGDFGSELEHVETLSSMPHSSRLLSQAGSSRSSRTKTATPPVSTSSADQSSRQSEGTEGQPSRQSDVHVPVDRESAFQWRSQLSQMGAAQRPMHYDLQERRIFDSSQLQEFLKELAKKCEREPNLTSVLTKTVLLVEAMETNADESQGSSSSRLRRRSTLVSLGGRSRTVSTHWTAIPLFRFERIQDDREDSWMVDSSRLDRTKPEEAPVIILNTGSFDLPLFRGSFFGKLRSGTELTIELKRKREFLLKMASWLRCLPERRQSAFLEYAQSNFAEFPVSTLTGQASTQMKQAARVHCRIFDENTVPPEKRPLLRMPSLSQTNRLSLQRVSTLSFGSVEGMDNTVVGWVPGMVERDEEKRFERGVDQFGTVSLSLPVLTQIRRDCTDLYIDAVRFLGDDIDGVRVRVSLEGDGTRVCREAIDIDARPFAQRSRRAREWRGSSNVVTLFDTRVEVRSLVDSETPAATCSLLFAIDCISRAHGDTDRVFKGCIGVATLPLFCDPLSVDLSAPKHADAADIMLNEGAFQLPLHRSNGGPALPCASILVRLRQAPRSRDRLRTLSKRDVPSEQWADLGLEDTRVQQYTPGNTLDH
ncbi:MAG: hypothetical protein MHM6MM_001255 [Cercozoa sp. M6MM]